MLSHPRAISFPLIHPISASFWMPSYRLPLFMSEKHHIEIKAQFRQMFLRCNTWQPFTSSEVNLFIVDSSMHTSGEIFQCMPLNPVLHSYQVCAAVRCQPKVLQGRISFASRTSMQTFFHDRNVSIPASLEKEKKIEPVFLSTKFAAYVNSNFGLKCSNT